MNNRKLKSFLKKFMCVAGLALVALLQGCVSVNSGSIEHGFHTYNHDTILIKDIKILYGSKTITFPGVWPSKKPPIPNQGSSYGVWMPIQEEMTITWHTEMDSTEHRATISLKDKVSYTKRLANWQIHFFGERMELWRQDDNGPVNANGYFPPRTETKVFP